MSKLEVPIFESPMNVKVSKITVESVLLSWSQAPHNNKTYSRRFTAEYKQVDSPEIYDRDISHLYEKEEECMATINKLAPGTYIFRVKVIFVGIAVLCSNWTDPISTTETTSAAETQLKLLLDKRKYETMKELLDVSHLEEFLIKENLMDHLQVGCIYDMNSDKPIRKLQIYPKVVSQIRLPEKLKIDVSTKKRTHAKITCVYQEYKESLTNVNHSSQISLQDTIFVHYISSQIKGFVAEINLFTNQEDETVLKELIDFIRSDTQSIIPPNTSISIAGKLPPNETMGKKILQIKDIAKLGQFFCESYYENLGEYLTLNIGILPLNLLCYYSPLFEKLLLLKQNLSSLTNPSFVSVTTTLINNVFNRIKLAAELIKSGGYYLPQNQFLKDLNESWLLNATKMMDFHQTIQTSVSDQLKLINTNSLCKSTWSLNFQIKVTLSLDSSVKNMVKLIEEVFSSTRPDINISSSELLKYFPDTLLIEKDKLEAVIDDMQRRFNFMKELDSTMNITLSISFVAAWDNNEQTSIEAAFCKHGKSINPQPPFSSVPYEVNFIRLGKNSIKLCWKLSEEALKSATLFKIHFRLTKGEKLPWQSIIKEDKDMSVVIHDLPFGNYEVSVQTFYGDFPGFCSDLCYLEHVLCETETKSLPHTQDKAYYFYDFGGIPSDSLIEIFHETVDHMRKVERCVELLGCFSLASASVGDLYDAKSKVIINQRPLLPTDGCSLTRHNRAVSLYVNDECNEVTVFKTIVLIKYLQGNEMRDGWLPNVTINDASAVYAITSIHWGNHVEIKLSTKKQYKVHLDRVCQDILDRLEEQVRERHPTLFKREYGSPLFDFDWSIPIYFSISSNCAGSIETCKNTLLKKENISKILLPDYNDLLNFERYMTPIYLQIVSLDLESYFGPLLTALRDLIIPVSKSKDETSVIELTRFIITEVLAKIKKAISFIENYGDFESALRSLHYIANSDLLDLKCIKDFLYQLKSFECTLINACNAKLASPDDEKKSILVQVCMTLKYASLEEIQSEMRRLFQQPVAQYFHTILGKVEDYVSYQLEKVIALKQCNSERNIQFEVINLGVCPNGVTMRIVKDGVQLDERIPLLEGPTCLRVIQTTKSSITLAWNPVLNSNSYVRSYRMDYRQSDESQWKTVYSNNAEPFKTVGNLSCGVYVFRVQTIYENIGSLFSDESEPVSTRIALAEQIVANLSPISNVDGSTPVLYELPLIEMKSDFARVYYYKKYIKNSSKEKTILLLGTTCSGKSTLINGLVNFIFNVNYSDHFRLKLPNKEGDKEWITLYHIPSIRGSNFNHNLNIINVPSFDNTAGDIDPVHIKSFLEKEVTTLTAVCFVIPNTTFHLSPAQQSIFDRILPLFGIKEDKIFIMITFADSNNLPVISTLKDASVTFSRYFTFNNSALYSNNSDGNYSRIFWNMAVDSFQNFLVSIK